MLSSTGSDALSPALTHACVLDEQLKPSRNVYSAVRTFHSPEMLKFLQWHGCYICGRLPFFLPHP